MNKKWIIYIVLIVVAFVLIVVFSKNIYFWLSNQLWKILLLAAVFGGGCIIRKSKCSTDFKRNDFLKKNEAYPLGALRSLKFAYRKLRISLFVELAV